MTEQIGSQGGSGPVPPVDRRQSQAAAAIARGAGRVLRAHGMAYIAELPLANGRRADITGLSPSGELWIIEIKSGIEDFRSDLKWPEYREFCDRLYFAVAPGFPADIIPLDTGLIIADRYGGEIARSAPSAALPAQRRKAMHLRFARAAALRLAATIDPDPETRAQLLDI